MTLPTKDLLATDDKLLNRKPFTRTLQAIAASFSWSGFDNWRVHELETRQQRKQLNQQH